MNNTGNEIVYNSVEELYKESLEYIVSLIKRSVKLNASTV